MYLGHLALLNKLWEYPQLSEQFTCRIQPISGALQEGLTTIIYRKLSALCRIWDSIHNEIVNITRIKYSHFFTEGIKDKKNRRGGLFHIRL
jgi:hypothetical protein